MRLNRTTRITMLALLITGLVIGAFGAGIGATWLLLRPAAPGGSQATSFELFWEAWHLVEDNFYGDLPDMHQVAWGAIRGALNTLDDPHTTFLEPQPRQREKEQLSGQFGGIGAYINEDEDGIISLDPMPDLPAERAGVVQGDILLKVDDTEITLEMTAEDVVNLIRGEVGSIVRLTLRREGQAAPIVLEVQRQEIPSASVEWRMLEEAEGMGYVRIALFSGRTALELEDAIGDLEDQGMTRLILDLRGNGGGLFDAGIDVASEFLSDGVVVYQLEKGSREQVYEVSRKASLPDAPLALLVDGGTASASEIVAGALQDRGRAVLVGQKTYGKGTVQSVYDLSDGSSVHITYAEWLTPERRRISGEGLMPDLDVPITENDRSEGRDPQLERAIEYLAAQG
ncbi:MAG: S41 family peptidase [Anaerolineae bacterium]|nr:S41 family peptidase [Anaerolineae bacterium]MDX9831638.1 S41 family peptidase [Anaerolineae bacterium]